LLVVLNGYDTWSAILREEHRLTLFKNWVVRKISGAKREEVQETGENYIFL
jgi:inactivated superfamily I helicase